MEAKILESSSLYFYGISSSVGKRSYHKQLFCHSSLQGSNGFYILNEIA